MIRGRKLAVTAALGALLVAGAGSTLAMPGPSGQAAAGPPAGMGMGGMGTSGTNGTHVDDEASYIAEMVPHHEEAIATAREVLARSERPEMRAFASAIIDSQSAQVEEMNTYLDRWYPGRGPATDYVAMMGDLTQLSGDELDRVFLERMIPHHAMAVMMSQQLLAGGLAVHPEVTELATTIRDDQRAEIMMMMRWLRAWFGVSGHGHP